MTVDEFVQRRVLPEFHDIVAAIRQLMREVAPMADETIGYGIPVWKCTRIIAALSPTKKDITFSFSRGAELDDRYGLLGGVGKVSKFVKMKDFNKTALRYYIKQAVEFDRR